MTPSTKMELEIKAKSWIRENRDTIEIFRGYVPTEYLPDENEEEEDFDLGCWVMDNGPECESSVGFKIVEIKSEDGGSGFALFFVKGSSWEGIRIYLEGLFESAADAEKYVESLGCIYGWES